MFDPVELPIPQSSPAKKVSFQRQDAEVKMSRLFAQFLWNPLCGYLIEDIVKHPKLVPVMGWCMQNFVPVLKSLQGDNVASVMNDFIKSTRTYQDMLLNRNIDFLKQHDNKFVHCLCLPSVFANKETPDELKNEIWQHLLGLQLVASSVWEIPPALCHIITELMPTTMPERKADGQFSIPDISPLLERAIQVMANQEVSMEDVFKAVEHARLLLRGGRTKGEKSPLKRIASRMPKDPPYHIFHQLYNILEILANMNRDELDPLFNLVSDRIGIDASEFSDEDIKDPQKVQQFLQEKINTPQIKSLLNSIKGQDSNKITQVMKDQLGFSSLDEATVLLHQEVAKNKAKRNKEPDFYDRIFQESQSKDAAVRTAEG